MTPRRGEVWLVDFDVPFGHEQGYRHPAVLVSSDDVNGGPAGVVIVVPPHRSGAACHPMSSWRPARPAST